MATSGGAPQEAALKIVGEADDEAARTYVFRGEDHTLGNAEFGLTGGGGDECLGLQLEGDQLIPKRYPDLCASVPVN